MGGTGYYGAVAQHYGDVALIGVAFDVERCAEALYAQPVAGYDERMFGVGLNVESGLAAEFERTFAAVAVVIVFYLGQMVEREG